ncbi:MAG: hypothetical protein QW561_04445 [Candidatus Aenigmatarchaeota archaeon]
MHLDWMVGLAIFLLIFSWSFGYFISMLPSERIDFHSQISQLYLENLSVNCWSIPVRFYSQNTSNETLYAVLPFSAESVAVFHDGQSLPCHVEGGKVYWNAQLVNGWNYFTIYLSQGSWHACKDEINITKANLSESFSAIKEKRVSFAKIQQLVKTEQKEGIRIEFEINNSVFAWGIEPAEFTEIKVTEKQLLLDEGGVVKIRIKTW